MSETVNFIQGSKNNYDSSTMQGGVYFSKDSKEILLNGESYGNAVPADEEDITAANGSLKLKDREVDAANFQSRGYKILRKNIVDGKNILTQDMINQPNTIYEIRYDFDLNGVTITIPDNCILKFEGGVLSNGNIKGTNTVIEAPLKQIFKFDRTKYYISGTWNLSKWNCSWFGTVSDGKAYKAKYNDSGELEKTSESNYFEVLIEGTDNFEPIQEALDAAYTTNVRCVELELGAYRICHPLNIGWGNYQSINFKGIKKGHLGDITEALNEATIILCDTGTYGININSGYKVLLSDFDIIGWNGINYRKMFTMWQNTTYYVENPQDWNSERVNKLPKYGLEPMSPYAGIVTDAFLRYDSATNPYELPTPPVNIDTLTAQNSSGLTVERVTSTGFCVGFGLEVGNYADNSDFFKFYNCTFSNNVYGFTTGSNQARNTALHECDLGGCYTAISNTKVGKQNGGLYGFISNCWFDSCYKILDYKEDISPVTFYNCYCENAYMIGNTSNISSRIENSVKFIDCNFRFTSKLSNPLGVPTYYFHGNCMFIRTSITAGDDSTLIPLFMESGNIEKCYLSINNLARDKECLFNPYLSNKINVTETTNSNTRNRINEYNSNINGLNIQLNKTNISPQLKHTAYSYDSTNRLLTINTNWVGTTASYQNAICVGDIIFQNTKTLYAIIKITPSADNNTATIICTPIQGYRKVDSEYICFSEITDSIWTIYPTRIQSFDTPLIILNTNDKKLTLKDWNENLKAGISLSIFHDYAHSFNFESGLIESVDKENKKITLKYNYWLNDTFKVINGYLDSESKYWKDTWVQDFIDKYN